MSWIIEPLIVDGPLFEGAISVYADAFAQPPYSDPDRGDEVRSRLRDVHSKRPGFRGFAATESDRRVLGMIYGYHGAQGQWWHDTVRKALSRQMARDWLSDSYELVEVAVDPGEQSRGIGQALILALLDGRPETTCVLSTRIDSRAHELYRRLSFDVLTEMAFSPGGARFYVMGKRLR